MTSTKNFRQSFAAIVCTIVVGSVALIGAVGPAIPAPAAAHIIQTIA